MSRIWRSTNNRQALNWVVTTSGSGAAFALDSAATLGTSGDMVAVRFVAMEAVAIDEFYIFLDDVAGNLGNITMRARIVNENTGSQPGTTVRATSTATTMPTAVDRWIKFTFGTPYTPAVGEVLWVVVDNTSASPTVDYPSIQVATNFSVAHPVASGFTTTNGFSSDGSGQVKMPYVLVQGSNVMGQPFTGRIFAPFANNTRKRGIAGVTPDTDVVIRAIEFTANSALNGIEIFEGSAGPGTTPLISYALGSTANQTTDKLVGCKAIPPLTLSAGTTYRVVLTFGSNSNILSSAVINDYSSYSSVFDKLYDGFALAYSTIDDGAGGWTDNKEICPAMSLILDEFPAASGGGGLLRHPGMRGGIHA